MKMKPLIIMTVNIALLAQGWPAIAAPEQPAVVVATEVKRMKSARPQARMAALQALSKTRDRAAAREVAAHLQQEKDSSLRSAAVVALGAIGGDDAAAALRETYLNPKETRDLRMEALEGLSRMSAPAAFDTVVAALKDTDPQIRRVAAGLLWQTYPREKIARYLAPLKNDADEQVKSSVISMLEFKPKK